MKCPIDGTNLAMTDRQGIEIDYCPECRGVWLDRGELDKMIAATGSSSFSGGAPTGPAPQPQQQQHQQPAQDYRRYDDDDDDDHHRRDNRHYESGYHEGGHHKKHKKEGFLGDLFDF
jgi:Zn-finger nucleic acid-binding protein